jgi:hypothetical protein
MLVGEKVVVVDSNRANLGNAWQDLGVRYGTPGVRRDIKRVSTTPSREIERANMMVD